MQATAQSTTEWSWSDCFLDSAALLWLFLEISLCDTDTPVHTSRSSLELIKT